MVLKVGPAPKVAAMLLVRQPVPPIGPLRRGPLRRTVFATYCWPVRKRSTSSVRPGASSPSSFSYLRRCQCGDGPRETLPLRVRRTL